MSTHLSLVCKPKMKPIFPCPTTTWSPGKPEFCTVFEHQDVFEHLMVWRLLHPPAPLWGCLEFLVSEALGDLMGQLTPPPPPTQLLTHAYLESLVVFEHLDDLVEHLPPQHLLGLASILHRVQEHEALTVVLQPAHQPHSLSPLSSGTWRPLIITACVIKNWYLLFVTVPLNGWITTTYFFWYCLYCL